MAIRGMHWDNGVFMRHFRGKRPVLQVEGTGKDGGVSYVGDLWDLALRRRPWRRITTMLVVLGVVFGLGALAGEHSIALALSVLLWFALPGLALSVERFSWWRRLLHAAGLSICTFVVLSLVLINAQVAVNRERVARSAEVRRQDELKRQEEAKRIEQAGQVER